MFRYVTGRLHNERFTLLHFICLYHFTILGCFSHKCKRSCPNLSFLYHMEAISQGLFIKSCMYSWDGDQCNNYLSFRVDQSKLNKTLNFILSDDNTLCILNRESFFSRNRAMQFLLWEKSLKSNHFMEYSNIM